MRNRRWFAIFVAAFFSLLSFPGWAQTLVIDPAFDTTRIDLPGWYALVRPVAFDVAPPVCVAESLDFIKYTAAQAVTCTGPVYLSSSYPNPPQDFLGTKTINYRNATHELMHAYQMAWAAPVFVEGDAQAKTNLIHRILAKKAGEGSSETAIFMADIASNSPREMQGGTSNPSRIPTLIGQSYTGPTAPLEFLYGVLGTSKPFTDAWAPHNLLENPKRMNPNVVEDTFDALQDLLPAMKINGVNVSTFLRQSPSYFLDGIHGKKFFGTYAWDVMQTGTPFSNSLTPINPKYLTARILEHTLTSSAETVAQYRWRVYDPDGVMLMDVRGATNGNNIFPRTFPGWKEGAYRVSSCVLQEGSQTQCLPDLTDTTYFIVYRKEWTRGKMFIIGNGPGYEDMDGWRTPRVVSAQSDGIETYPGLVVVNAPRGDVVVENGELTRTFTPDPDVSTIYLMTRRDQPFLRFASMGKTAPSGKLSPGKTATAVTWGATHLDPHMPDAASASRFGCADNRTLAALTDPAGSDWWLTVRYCSQNRVDFDVPGDFPVGPAKLRIILGATPSNQIDVTIE